MLRVTPAIQQSFLSILYVMFIEIINVDK